MYAECIKCAEEYGDSGDSFCFFHLEGFMGLSENQLKGYVGSLVKKNKLQVQVDSYFDFTVTELYKF